MVELLVGRGLFECLFLGFSLLISFGEVFFSLGGGGG